jgi:prepilin peptidase CpaA
MTPQSVAFLALLSLVVLLLAAAWCDQRSHRIPNPLVFGGAILGLVLNGLLPQGFGFNSVVPGGLGLWEALQGLGLGLAVLLPLYWLRAMGAGDVKLMAMVGAFLGPGQVLGALLCTFLIGGVMALTITLRAGAMLRLLENMKLLLIDGVVKVSTGQVPTVDDLPESVGKMPYAVAIAIGTLGYMVWCHMRWY